MKKIVRGNDFSLRIPVMQMSHGEQVAFPLPACTNVKVRLCGTFRRTELDYDIDVEQDNVLAAKVDSKAVGVGRYAIEVRGELLGKSWRSEEYPQIEIVERNADADTTFDDTDEGDKSVDLDTMLVIMPPSVELRGLIDDTNNVLEQAKTQEKAREEAEIIRSKSETERDIAERDRLSAEDERRKSEEERLSNESARIAEEQARDSAESKRSLAESERQKLMENAIAECEKAVEDAKVAISYSPDNYGIIIETGTNA